ncbi:MAG: succinate dehydrogenase [Acidobacteria bacterium]|nr:succinate dehydrogenase [Acidobacteriota bacterium]MBI3469808.1 succinate dehydrogenase [Candidatus Solibacter usitatus]
MVDVSWERGRFGQTARRDGWWVEPLVVFLVLGTFVVYTTWAALQGNHYYWGPYLSPFYSPELFGDSPHRWFGPQPSWWASWLPWSPALPILWVPALFRLSCYYYRGAYYKSFWADPPACAVSEPRASYRGEHSFPLILQNIHRYFLYLAILFLGCLAYDVWKAMWFPDSATGRVAFGLGVGTLVLAANVVMLGGYTFGCHSVRHLVGGRFDLLSPFRLKTYACVSCLNGRHKRWAWMSLFSVMFSDLYIRLCSMGVWTDWRIL